jgi:hypothetical protein
MSMAYLAQPDEQQKLEWLDGEVFSVLMDGAATDRQLTVSLGYPREWTPRGLPRPVLRPIRPTPESR